MKGIITNKFYIFTFLSLLLSKIVYAIDCSGLPTEGPALPSQLLCPVYRIINVLLIGGGILLAVILGLGAIKLSVALGDPKGFEGGKKTWTFAILGFCIVIGAFTILVIIGRLLTNNEGFLGISGLQSSLEVAYCDLLEGLFITDPGCE